MKSNKKAKLNQIFMRHLDTRICEKNNVMMTESGFLQKHQLGCVFPFRRRSVLRGNGHQSDAAVPARQRQRAATCRRN